MTTNLGITAAARGDVGRARRRYRQAARELRELGLWPPLARAVHNLGLTWPPESATRRHRVLPAWLALDTARFALTTAAERSRWRDTIGAPGAAAFDSAARHSPMLLAEVIEHARAVGTADDPAPPPAIGLVGVPGPTGDGPVELAVRTPLPVDPGWPSVLTPYRVRSTTLRPAPEIAPAGDRARACLIRLLRAAVPAQGAR